MTFIILLYIYRAQEYKKAQHLILPIPIEGKNIFYKNRLLHTFKENIKNITTVIEKDVSICLSFDH